MHKSLVTLLLAAVMVAACMPQQRSFAKRDTTGGVGDQIASLIEMGSTPPQSSQPAQPSQYEDACLAELERLGAVFAPTEPVHTSRGCGMDNPVVITAGVAEIGPSVEVNCPMALLWRNFDENVLQSLADEMFGEPIVYVRQFAGYTCRNSTGNSAKLSRHAYGNAMDIASFELADGTEISVEDDFYDSGEKGQFLRAFAESACAYFNVVLTPNSDSAHYNHFHVDIGETSICSL